MTCRQARRLDDAISSAGSEKGFREERVLHEGPGAMIEREGIPGFEAEGA